MHVCFCCCGQIYDKVQLRERRRKEALPNGTQKYYFNQKEIRLQQGKTEPKSDQRPVGQG